MYSMDELKTWWEVPAIAHFFSLFKSCFSLTDFTIEELEDSLLSDGEDDKSTTFISRLLTELLQGCYENPNISVTTYHETLIHIMKKRWEEEDGRVNPLMSVNADFHSLPARLKVQIIHRLTEYRLDAKDVVDKLSGLDPSDLRFEPLGEDHHGSKYWYFFGVRLYKETPSSKKGKKRKIDMKIKKKELKKAKLPHEGFGDNTDFGNQNSGNKPGDEKYSISFMESIFDKKNKKKSKKKHKKNKRDLDNDGKNSGFRYGGLSESKWEVICYNISDWIKLATMLQRGESRREEALCQLITENFLPNLPKIVEDMEQQQQHLKEQMELLPRRSSCRLLAKKLYEEEDGVKTDSKEMSLQRLEALKCEKEEREKIQNKERDERLKQDFEALLQLELERKKKEDFAKWQKEREEEKLRRLSQGILLESESSSDESFQNLFDPFIYSKKEPTHPPLNSPVVKNETNMQGDKDKGSKRKNSKNTVVITSDSASSKKRGRPPGTAKKVSKLIDSNNKSSEKTFNLNHQDQQAKNNDQNKAKQELEGKAHETTLVTKTAGNHEYKAMNEAWKIVDTNPEAWPFQKPVEEWYAPGYHNIIKRPMDLSTIETKLIERKYKTVLEFKDDITLMFNNCRLYNGPDNEYTQVANTLDEMFQKTLIANLSKKSADSKSNKTKPSNKVNKTRKSEETGNLPPNPEIAEPAYQELFEDFEDDLDDGNDSEDESSDEFAPPGVSKIKLKKARLEFAGKIWKGRGGKEISRGTARSVVRGRGRRSAVSPAKTKEPVSVKKSKSRAKSEESSSEESDTPSKRVAMSPSKKRGRPSKPVPLSKSGRKASVDAKRKISTASKKSNYESSDQDETRGNQTIRKRPAKRGSTTRGRGRGSRVSTQTRHSESDSESSSEDDEDECANDEDKLGKKLGLENRDCTTTHGILDSAPKLANPLRLPDEYKDEDDVGSVSKKKRDNSPVQDAESSSSSSRTPPRSHSLEKFEKLEEDAKSNPQVLWSLDYLASQARVLEEQYSKTENSSTKLSSKKQSNQPNLQSSQRLFRMSRRDSGITSPVDVRKPIREENEQRKELSNASGKPFASNTQFKHLTSDRKREDQDIYNFNDDESSSNPFGVKPKSSFTKSNDESVTVSSAKSPGNHSSLRTENPSITSLPSSHINSNQSERNNDVNQGKSIDNTRRPSVDPLSSPQTPSSGYGSNRTASFGQYSSSPYPGSDNNSVAPKSSEDFDTEKTSKHTDMPKVDQNNERNKVLSSESHLSRTNLQAPDQRPDLAKQTSHPSFQGMKPNSKLVIDRVSSDSHSIENINPTLRRSPPMQHPAASQRHHPGALNKSTVTSTASNNDFRTSSHFQTQALQSQMSPSSNQLQSNRRLSQHQVADQPLVKSPVCPQTSGGVTGGHTKGRDDISDPALANNQRTEDTTIPARLPLTAKLSAPSDATPQLVQHARMPGYTSVTPQSQPGNQQVNPSQQMSRKQPQDSRPQQPNASHSYEQQTSNRAADPSFRNSVPNSSTTHQQQRSYNYGVSTATAQITNRSTSNTAHTHETSSSYHQRGNQPAADSNMVMQHPTMENFGLTPWSLAQPLRNDMTNRPTPEVSRTAQRKTSNPPGGFPGHKQATHNNPSLPQQQQNVQTHRQSQPAHPYHSAVSTSMVSSKSQQPPSNISSGRHHPVKPRNSSTSNSGDGVQGSNVSASKQRHSNSSASTHSGRTSSGSSQAGSASSASNRRQSGNGSLYQQKSHTDYMGYHIPPTPAPTPRDTRTTTYSPHQHQNGLLSATGPVPNNNPALLHQDFTASATLRALQQQHKSDRPSHAAASMLHYAAANEQYSRLAASAHHRATSQHAHPLAGVYHPHPQNATASTAQAATHLGSPWLQAAAPGAGYPSNLIPHHIDPMYHLMQQSGMHGQYPMYSNSVMQQLHQQHLQHHMLPKY